ncbi:MAG: hypothetical protein DRZ90_11695 [Spirochaetes bacterium]|nr:MAG: hypothetical protein DRZ90_11695 [Spirochaetota bacterium]
MDLSQEQLNSIGNFVQLHLHEWIDDRIINQRERIIRVEESLKHQYELMKQGFDNMEKRFTQIDKRFEQVDKRFEEMRQDTKDRFERVDKQFAWVYTFLSATFITILGGIVTLIVRSV